MTPERWQQIKPILNDARERPAAGRREWLAEACGGDPGLLADVESFLAHEDRLEGFIETPVLSFAAEPADLDERYVGRRVGPYRLLRLLGRGGMGAVYLAERQEEFVQRVALKLVRRELTSHQTIRRFQEERQILARLEHPNIARLLDGGTTEDGAPYFAMELVDGVPIDRYCDERRLSTRRRLDLFLSVCSALELAHQNLVIHRDLKPGNVLVDASGTPKLLDFGIAKLLPAEGAAGTLSTPTQQQALTLRYASPEQVRGEPVGTVSDVYSLGVVLYQVLTGRLPCGLDHLHGLSLILAVCEQAPVAPSVAVLRSEEHGTDDGGVRRLTPESVSAVRDGDARTLRRRLAGDVDAIVAKTLQKEPRHRYASIGQLAADLRRHLQDLPVLAHPGSFTYRAGKLARRHRLGLAGLAAVLLIACGFTVALVRQLRETGRARDRAEAVSTFLVDLFQAAVPDRRDDEPTMRDLLDLGRRELEAGLEREPEVRATLLLKMGEVYVKLGDYAEARELLAGAIGILRAIHPGDDPTLATALNDLAVVHHGTGELESAEKYLRESIAMRRRLGSEADLIKPMNGLAAVLLERGDFREAEEIYRETLAQRRATLGDRHPNVATGLRSLGTVLYQMGDLDAAETLLRESLDIRREVDGPESTAPSGGIGGGSTAVASTLLSLGRVEHARGRHDEAESLYAEALSIRRRKLGEDHHHTALAKMDLADLLLGLGETATAGVLLPQVLETLYRVRPAGDWQVAEAESLLGAYLVAEGRPETAAGCLENAYRTLELRRGPRAMETQTARRRLSLLQGASPP